MYLYLLLVCIYMILFFSASYIAQFYGMPLLTWVIRVMGLRLPLAAINSIQQAFVSKKLQFKKFFVSTLGGTLFSAALGIVLALLEYGVWALVAQYLGNVTLGTIILAFTSGWKPQLIYSQKRMNKLFSFGWKIMLVGVMTSVYSNLRNLLIGKKYSSIDLALSTKGEQFPSTIAGNISSSINKVLFPVLSEKQHDLGAVKRIMRRSINVGNFIMLPLLCGMATVAKSFVTILLTDKWLGCVPYLQIMCIVYALQPMQTSSLQVIKALGKGNLYLTIDVIKKAFGLIVLFVSVFCFDSVIIIIVGALITELFSTIINMLINKRLVNYTIKEQFYDLSQPVAMTAIMCLGVWLVSLLDINTLVQLGLQVVVGALIYLLLAIISKNETYKYIFELTRGYFV